MPSSAGPSVCSFSTSPCDDLDAVGQCGAARVAREAAHVEPAPQQLGREVAADVAGGAGDQDLGHVLATVRGARGMSPGGGVVRTGHDGWTADGRWTEHQRGRRADRAGARHDPHVGAAPRLPQPRGAPPRATAATSADDVETLRRARAHRQRGLSVSAALERARETGGDLRPPVDLRRGGGDRPRRPPAGPAQVDAGRALARDRARAAGPRRRAGALRRLPARALLPRARAALAPDGAPRRRRDRVRRLRHAAPAVGRAGRGADRRGRGAGQRVGGDRRRARLRGVPAGLGAARRDRARGPEDRDRRFEAIWTIDPRATRRAAQAAARLAGNVDAGVRPPARGAAGRSPAGAWSSRRPRSRR